MSKELINIIKLTKIRDDATLIVAQVGEHIPFGIKRSYTIDESDLKLSRGFHAHKTNRQVMRCLKSSIRVIMDDGQKREDVILDKPENALLIDKMIWHEMHDFKKETILLVLASELYDPDDYIRDYKEFLRAAKTPI